MSEERQEGRKAASALEGVGAGSGSAVLVSFCWPWSACWRLTWPRQDLGGGSHLQPVPSLPFYVWDTSFNLSYGDVFSAPEER